jgi:hypothetical protein
MACAGGAEPKRQKPLCGGDHTVTTNLHGRTPQNAGIYKVLLRDEKVFAAATQIEIRAKSMRSEISDYTAISRFSANGHCSSIHWTSQRNPAVRAI